MRIVVKRGDTLWALAATHLGNGQRWCEIYAQNRPRIIEAQNQRRVHYVKPEDHIFPGTVLDIQSGRHTLT